MKYYCYRHIRLDKNEPFYIGIGVKRNQEFTSLETEYRRAFDSYYRSKFWKAIYNKSTISVEILFESDDYEEIKKKEQEFISLYGRKNLGKGTLVNLTDGGDGSLGWKPSETTRQKISQSRIGKKYTNGRRSANLGMTGEKSAVFGIKHSPEVRLKISKAVTGKNLGGSNPSARPVIQYDLQNNFICEFETATKAALAVISKSTVGNILHCCKGEQKTAYGFIWKYKFEK